MAATSVGIGWMEVLLILLGGGGWLGMPPGERDAALLKAAPQQSLLYVEWAARGLGKAGAAGIDGFAADPEIQALFAAIDKGLAPADKDGDEDLDQLPQHLYGMRLAKLVTAHSGCIFVLAGPPQAGKGLAKVSSPAEILAGIHGCIILNAGTDAGAILQAVERTTHEKIPLQPQMHRIPGPLGLTVTIHQEGDRLLFALGAGTVERTLAGLRGETPGLDSNPRFQAGWKRIAMDRVGTVGWFDLKGIADVVFSSLGSAGVDAQAVQRGAGADALDFLVTGSGVVDGHVIQRSFLATGGRTDGVMMLARNPALRLEQLSHMPADSDLVLAASLDLSQLVTGIRELVAKTHPLSVRVFDEAIRELEAELELSLVKDVYPAFGNAWTAFSAPSEGGVLGSSLIVAVEVRDPEKAKVIFDRLMQTLEQSLAMDDSDFVGATAELKQQEFLGHSIKYIRSSGWNIGLAPSAIPSFCLTRGHVLFAVHPQAMKAHLCHLNARRPGFDTVARSKLSHSNQELLLAGYYDGAKATQTLSGLVPFLGKTLTEMAQGNGWEFDPFFIPSSAALVPYSGDITLSLVRQKDGLLIESKNPQLGMALLAALGLARSFASEGVFLDARRQNLRPVENAGLGAAEGNGKVVGAAAEKLAPVPKEKTADVIVRRAVPVLLRAFVPDGIQPLIPDAVYRKLAEPPSPEVLKQRETRRKLNEERRRERLERQRAAPRP